MGQIQGALVGIATVLLAVSYRWPSWRFYWCTDRQFSITIVSAMALSVLVALILDSALLPRCSKPIAKGHDGEGKKVLRLG
ncbi:hypothetical protein ACNKHL_02380 [Shigella flexneri]